MVFLNNIFEITQAATVLLYRWERFCGVVCSSEHSAVEYQGLRSLPGQSHHSTVQRSCDMDSLQGAHYHYVRAGMFNCEPSLYVFR